MKLVDPYEFGINRNLARKYNAIVRFMQKNKEVIYQKGCYNGLLIDLEYKRADIKNSFTDTDDCIILKFEDGTSKFIEEAKELRIDRKFKMIEDARYINF